MSLQPHGFNSQSALNVRTLGERTYMLTICAFTAVFIGVATIGAQLTYDWQITGMWLNIAFAVACIVVSVIGRIVAEASDNPVVSFIGGGICAIGLGALVGPFVAQFALGNVVQALMLTGCVVLVMGLIGAIVPANLSAWGAPLMGLLIGAIVIQFGAGILAAFGINMALTFGIIDWAVLLLFCGIMIYDLNRARQLERTLDNAIDMAVDVFVNFINIFVRILLIVGRSDD